MARENAVVCPHCPPRRGPDFHEELPGQLHEKQRVAARVNRIEVCRQVNFRTCASGSR